VDKARPFCIEKREVWEAFKRIKANQGAAGVDGQSIAEFEKDLSNNLYRIWSRMSSGSYFPPAVLRVEIPKDNGAGVRPLGIPTVSDRIAQMVVKRYLEPKLEELFHNDSYGYRPGRSAHEALYVARSRCWKYDWVLDLDIKGFFDNIDWDADDEGRTPSHGLQVGAAVHRKMAAGAREHAGRYLGKPGEGNAARVGGQSRVGESLSPLRVRHAG
jgi:RNA-directed DNA polymerase